MRKIVFFDVHTTEEAQYYKRALKNTFAVETIYTDEPLTEVTARKYSDAAVASVSVTSNVNDRVLSKVPELEYIASRSGGCEHIDIEAAGDHDVLVSTVSAHVEATVAEHTIMLLLALTRRLREGMQHLQEGLVDYSDLTGFEVAGKTMGLLGCGRIGRYVAKIAAGLDMEVIGYDPDPAENQHISYVDFQRVIEESDVISLHAPWSETTHHMINADTIACMQPGTMLLNTASGSLVDTSALIDALFSGHISAAGLDVLEGEQLLRFGEELSLLHPDTRRQDLLLNTEHHALMRMSNVIITPHNGFNSYEALGRIWQETVENIKQYLKHEPRNVVKHA